MGAPKPLLGLSGGSSRRSEDAAILSRVVPSGELVSTVVLNNVNLSASLSAVATLHGPRKISPQLQVKIPRNLARELRLEGGDDVFFRLSDDDPGVLLVIPGEVVERRYQAGEELQSAQRSRASTLEVPTSAGRTTRAD